MNIYIFPTGCFLHKNKSCRYEELIYISGPLISLLLATIGYFISFDVFWIINLKIAILNMLPALPLDGGMLIRVIIWRNYGIYYGTKITKFLTILTSLFLIVLGVLSRNLWLVLVSILLITALKQKPVPFCIKKPYAKIKIFTVNENCSLLKISRVLSSYYYTWFYLKSQDKFIHEDKITEYIKTHGMDACIYDI